MIDEDIMDTRVLMNDHLNTIQEAIEYADNIWPQIEGFFHFLSHSDSSEISSFAGANKIIETFKDWVENNGGWKDIQECDSQNKEVTIHRWMHLGAKAFLEDRNLDMNCESNIGVGHEDIKISRGNDKTIIEVKLSSNPDCKRGFEKQLPRYAEAEHTKQMIFVLILVDDKEWDIMKRQDSDPEMVIIDARPKKSASKL